MISAEVEIGVLGAAAREFEAAAELALRAADRLRRVVELAALNGDAPVVVALTSLAGECEAAKTAAVGFAARAERHAAVCDGIARAWSRRGVDAKRRAESRAARDAGQAGGVVRVTWGSAVEPVPVRVVVAGELGW